MTDDFEVTNALGKVVFTASDLPIARKWVRANCATFPGLKVERVIRTEQRLTVYRAPKAQDEQSNVTAFRRTA